MQAALFGWVKSKKLARTLETELQRELLEHTSPRVLRETIEQLEAAEKAAGESHVVVVDTGRQGPMPSV